MSFTFILTGGNKIEPFDIGRGMSGLWESFASYRIDPTERELLEAGGTDFYGWKLPWWRIYEMYAGVVAINALEPHNHPIYPQLDPVPGDFPEGYWRLLEPFDFDGDDDEIKPELDKAQADSDYRLAAKVNYLYKHFILNNLGDGAAEDYDGHLSVYFWAFLKDLQKWLHSVLQLREAGQLDEVRFHGG